MAEASDEYVGPWCEQRRGKAAACSRGGAMKSIRESQVKGQKERTRPSERQRRTGLVRGGYGRASLGRPRADLGWGQRARGSSGHSPALQFLGFLSSSGLCPHDTPMTH